MSGLLRPTAVYSFTSARTEPCAVCGSAHYDLWRYCGELFCHGCIEEVYNEIRVGGLQVSAAIRSVKAAKVLEAMP